MLSRPQTRDELTAWLRSRDARPLVIRGSHSDDSDLDQLIMSGLNDVVSYEPDEMIVVAEAGITLTKLNAILAERKQWIPAFHDAHLSSTLGGALAQGAWHPRERFGTSIRVAVLGGQFCTVDGSLFRSGSRVVKSVAGYDTHRAFVGSQGQLGIIIEVTLKVQPLPEKFERFWLATTRCDTLPSITPTVLEDYRGQLLCELAGYTEDVEADIASLNSREISITPVSDSDWNAALAALRLAHNNRVTCQPASSDLLQGLRRVLDPISLLQAYG